MEDKKIIEKCTDEIKEINAEIKRYTELMEECTEMIKILNRALFIHCSLLVKYNKRYELEKPIVGKVFSCN